MPIGVVCPSSAQRCEHQIAPPVARPSAPNAAPHWSCPDLAPDVPAPTRNHCLNPSQGPEPTPVPVMLAPEYHNSSAGQGLRRGAATDESPPDSRGGSLSALATRPDPAIQELDMHTKIAAWQPLLGLVVLAVSPLFKWMNFASGGVIGLKGDGGIVLGITLAAIGICIAVLIKPRWFKAGVLAVQAWGTVAVFWMTALIWKVGSGFDSSDIKDNPFAGLLASQISPGAGLYLGLIRAPRSCCCSWIRCCGPACSRLEASTPIIAEASVA